MLAFLWALGPVHQNPSRISENTRIPLGGLKVLECSLRDSNTQAVGAGGGKKLPLTA